MYWPHASGWLISIVTDEEGCHVRSMHGQLDGWVGQPKLANDSDLELAVISGGFGLDPFPWNPSA